MKTSALVHRLARYPTALPIARARLRALRFLILVAGLFCAPVALAQQHAVQEHMAAGRAAFERGAFDGAIESWSLAAIASERAGD